MCDECEERERSTLDYLSALFPQFTLPDKTRMEILSAVGKSSVDDDASGFIESIERALSNFLHMHGKWMHGPEGRSLKLAARDSKPQHIRTDYTVPLKNISEALEIIEQQLKRLPSDGVEWIEAGASSYLLREWGIRDAYPDDHRGDDWPDPPEHNGSGDICDPAPWRRFKFLLRLRALREGIGIAAKEAEVRLPAVKPSHRLRDNLIDAMAEAFENNLSVRPTSNSVTCDTPFVRVRTVVFDWLAETHAIPGPGADRLNALAKGAAKKVQRRRVE